MTPNDAVGVALSAVADGWDRGTPIVAGVFEDADRYAIAVGNAEHIDGGDFGFMVLDSPLVIVGKADGSASFVPYIGNESWIDSMEPILYQR